MKTKKLISILILCVVLCAWTIIPAFAITATSLNVSGLEVDYHVYHSYSGYAGGGSVISAACGIDYGPNHAVVINHNCQACVYAVDATGAPVGWAVSSIGYDGASTSSSVAQPYNHGEFFFDIGDISY